MSTDNDNKDGEKSQDDGAGKSALTADEIRAQIKSELEAEYKGKYDKLQSVINEKVEGKKELEERLRLEAEKRGEYDKALEMHKKELDEAKAEIDKFKATVSELEALKPQADQWTAYQEKRKAELLELVPEDLRDEYKDDSMESLEKALKLAGKNAQNGKPGVHKGAPGGKLDTSGITTLEGLTSQQRRELMHANPALFNQLVAKEIK